MTTERGEETPASRAMRNVESDREYAAKFLSFLRSKSYRNRANPVIWQTADAYLLAMTRRYPEALSSLQKAERMTGNNEQTRRQHGMLKSIWTVANMPAGAAEIPEFSTCILMEEKRREKNAFLFAMGRELEAKGATTSAAFLYSHTNDVKDEWNQDVIYWRTRRGHVVAAASILHGEIVQLIHHLIDSACRHLGLAIGRPLHDISVIGLRCDWSERNREIYFKLLRALKREWGKTISCTLRLYPFKYRDRMGIPPVDRVMLMCYNLLHPQANPERNTILELDELNAYFGRKSAYPLPFDIALPVYSRTQLFQSDRFVKTLHASDSAMLPILRQTRPLWFEVTADTVFDNTYLRRGDAIKYEHVSAQELQKTAQLLAEKLKPSDTTTIALFHLDDNNLNRYPHEALEAAFTAFGR